MQWATAISWLFPVDICLRQLSSVFKSALRSYSVRMATPNAVPVCYPEALPITAPPLNPETPITHLLWYMFESYSEYNLAFAVFMIAAEIFCLKR